MNLIFFDTETTGVPIDRNGKMTNVANWPRVIQLAWELVSIDDENLTIKVQNAKKSFVLPDGWKIPTDKGDFWERHGYTDALLNAEGVPLPGLLDEFIKDLNESRAMVAHNLPFDYNVLGAEMIRYGKSANRNISFKRQKICTMTAPAVIDFCAVPFPAAGVKKFPNSKPRNFKWPTLQELYKKLFNEDFTAGHDAGNDVATTRACFFELLDRGILQFDEF